MLLQCETKLCSLVLTQRVRCGVRRRAATLNHYYILYLHLPFLAALSATAVFSLRASNCGAGEDFANITQVSAHN